MEKFVITGPDGKRYRIEAESAERAAQVFAAMSSGAPQQPEKAGGRVGAFVNKAVDMALLGFGDEVNALDHVYMPGNYQDRLNFYRDQEQTYTEENPVGAFAADMTGALATGATGIGRSLMARGGRALFPWMVRAGSGGAALAATEEFGEGEGNALARAQGISPVNVGVGAVLGGAGAAAGEGLAKLIRQIKGSPIERLPAEELSNILGIELPVAKTLRLYLDDEAIAEGRRVIGELGEDGMLADTPALMPVLDAGVNKSPSAGRIVTNALAGRATETRNALRAELDNALGSYESVIARQRAIREGGAGARRQLYGEAYSVDPDYSTAEGRMLLDLLGRMDDTDHKAAARLMRLEGEPPADPQRPGTRAIDYATRALGDAAEKERGRGGLGGFTSTGRALSNLSRDIRDLLGNMNPAYNAARDQAGDDIGRVNALAIGERALRTTDTRGELAEAMAGMSPDELTAVRQGMRAYVDEQLGNVKRVLAGNNPDVRDVQAAMRLLSSENVREKLRMALSDEDADAMFAALDRTETLFEVMAQLAQNSKTAMRTAIQKAIDQASGPSAAGEKLRRGEIVGALPAAAVESLGTTSDELLRINIAAYNDLARQLTGIRGAQAEEALDLLARAMRGEALSQRQTATIAMALGSGGASLGNDVGDQIAPGLTLQSSGPR